LYTKNKPLIDNEELVNAYENHLDNYTYQTNKSRLLLGLKAGFYDAFTDTRKNRRELLKDFVTEDQSWQNSYDKGQMLTNNLNKEQQSTLFLFFKGLNLTEISLIKSVSRQAIQKQMAVMERKLADG